MSGLVWIRVPEAVSADAAFLAAEIVGVDGDFTEVKLTQTTTGGKAGEVRRVPSSDTRQRFTREGSTTADDNTALVHMNDASILDNLEARHAQDKIYTYTASVLLAVNPYKSIEGLYGDAQCSLYKGKHLGALPPHPYAIADTAYRTLVREKLNQALLISGESGAGKTETAKFVMQYLAYASGCTSDLASKIQDRVLQAQPILESFGNAVTVRNSNSSRFGKYNRVFFDEEGTLVDAGITTYLLESSRVVGHGDRERTYHVFYEMLQGLSDEKMKELHLERGKQYRLLHSTESPGEQFEARDKNNFQRLCKALETVGMDQTSIDGCLRVLAGLMHLGDIPKEDADAEMAARAAQDDDDADTRTVDINEDSAAFAAELLGMDPDELASLLKRKRITIPGRDSVHEVPRSPMHFRQALHGMIKALYKRLFEQTVGRINDSFRELRPDQANAESVWKNIGILDIYGFERLQHNSFEQLCINLANERLQQYFVENVLVAEQQLYSREGLPWTGLKLPNSEPVVHCISQVFKTLDDFSSRMAKGFGEAQQVSDDRFCERVLKECAADPQRKDVLKAPKISAKNARNATGSRANELFVITHYAGTVDYNTKGWLDKNNDRLLVESESLILDSSFPFVKAMGDEDLKQTFRSISSKYSKDLEALLQTLGEANLHYIRCFKPNALQKPDLFNGQLVLDQIVQCGTIELVKIMHDGFPNRCFFEELCNRFKSLLPEKFQRYGMRTFIEALMLAYEVPRSEWALGMSRLFLKAGQLKALEDMRAGGVVPKPEILEGIVKEIVRKRWSRACTAIRLCNWLPKFLGKVYVKKAASTLTATAIVTGRVAKRLEAARHRVAERRRAVRRRLVGVFRTAHCLSQAWRQMREKRRQRAVNALFLGSFMLARAKPWIARARAYIHDADVRRQREEEQRLQELEKKMKLEEERLRLEAEKRRQEEEEKRQEEALKRQQEEEERRQAEAEQRRLEEEERQKAEAERARLAEEREAELEQQRLQREQQAEEMRKEQERKVQAQREEMEAERRRIEETMAEEKRRMKEELEAEKQQLAAQMAEQMEKERRRVSEELEAERLRAAELRSEQDDQIRKDMQEMKETVRRLSISQQCNSNVSRVLSETGATSVVDDSCPEDVAKPAAEDAETDIGDSVSCLGQQQQQAIQEVVNAETMKLMEAYASQMQTIQQQMKEMQEKNERLERQAAEQEPRQECGSPDLGLPVNGTPGGIAASPFTPISRRESMSMRRHSLLDSDARSSNSKNKRRSIAMEALESSNRGAVTLPEEPVSDHRADVERKWMAQQRGFLMQDLYGSPFGTPTPSRGARSAQKRLSQGDGPAS